LLGFPTRINPKKVVPSNIHKEAIDEDLLKEIADIKRFQIQSK
jgi:hypothetical protein